MKKIILFATVLSIIALSSCHKADTFDPVKQAATDDAIIQGYIKSNNITATKDSSGLYYSIITQGTGAYPKSTSTVTVGYKGTFVNGTVFDQSSTSLVISLKNVIPGWQIGVPLVKAGGRILLMIPSGLAYGNAGQGSVPPNTVLIFTIDVLSTN